jgi:hypothetical protein
MGRGRAKAKQTKVARQLKYSSGGTDLDRLQAELAGDHGSAPLGVAAEDVDETEDDDDFTAYAYEGDDEDEDSVGA